MENFSCREMRQKAWNLLEGQWLNPILTCLVYALISSVTAIPFAGLPLAILLYFPLTYGFYNSMLRFVRGNNEEMIETMFRTLKDYTRALAVVGMIVLYVCLWSLLFLIPGIIKSFSYAMAPMIALDHPEMSVDECINESMRMMDGHKMDFFLLELSFIGWGILGCLTCGILFLWIIPYYYTTIVLFYEELIKDQKTDVVIENIEAEKTAE